MFKYDGNWRRSEHHIIEVSFVRDCCEFTTQHENAYASFSISDEGGHTYRFRSESDDIDSVGWIETEPNKFLGKTINCIYLFDTEVNDCEEDDMKRVTRTTYNVDFVETDEYCTIACVEVGYLKNNIMFFVDEL